MSQTTVTSIGERIRRAARGTLPKSFYARCAAMADAFYGVRRFGRRGYKALSDASRSPVSAKSVEMHLRPLPYPFYVRPGTVDVSVVIHAIGREAYSYCLPDRPVNLVIDAGANIGDTTVWYAERFPEAHVVAVEPNFDTFEVLRKNCAPYGERIRLLNAGLWPVPEKILTVTGAWGGSQVREGQDTQDAEGPRCTAVDPLTILQESGFSSIDVFKIDIEGAELPLFSGACDVWLERTRYIAIEIHSSEAREVIMAATRRHGFTCAVYRDIHVFYKSSPRHTS